MLFSFALTVAECIEDSALTLASLDPFHSTTGALIRTDEQIQRFELGGNRKFREYLKDYDLDNTSINFKYKTKAAEAYRNYVV